jgi:hypothetical protein
MNIYAFDEILDPSLGKLLMVYLHPPHLLYQEGIRVRQLARVGVAGIMRLLF